MKFFKGLAGQTLIYGLGTIVPRLLNYLLLTPFYTRIFVQSQYGTVSELYAYSSLLIILLTHGMETTYFRFSVNKDTNEATIFNHALFSTGLFASLFLLFICFFNSQVATFIGYSDSPSYIICFGFIIFLDVITAIPFARLRNQNKALKFSIIKLLNVSVNIFLNIFFFIICKDSDNQILASFYNPNIGIGYAFISNVSSSLISFLLLLPEYKSFRFNINFSTYLKMLNFAWPLILVGLAGMINEVADKIFIKNLTSNSLDPLAQVGIYSANYKVAVLMSLFIQMFKYAAEPYFFKKSVNTDAKESYRIVMNYFVIFCLFIFLLVVLYIDLFKYFIGSNFHSGLDIVPIILIANMLLGIYYNLSFWYKLSNKTYCGAVLSTLGVIVTVSLNLYLIPIMGYRGSAWATLACYFVMVVCSYLWGQKVFKVNYDLGKISLFISLALLLYFAKSLFVTSNLFLSLLYSTLLIIIFLLVVLFTERKNLLSILCK